MAIGRFGGGRFFAAQDGVDDRLMLLKGQGQAARQPELGAAKRRQPRPGLRHQFQNMLVMGALIDPVVKLDIIGGIILRLPRLHNTD